MKTLNALNQTTKLLNADFIQHGTNIFKASFVDKHNKKQNIEIHGQETLHFICLECNIIAQERAKGSDHHCFDSYADFKRYLISSNTI